MRRAGVLLAIAATCAWCGAARADVSARSELTPPAVEPAGPGDAPILILAQRTIDRSWGPPEGTPPAAHVPGLLSEGDAWALSAALPGAGQWYAGQSSALWFALAEVAGWTSHWLFMRDANQQSEHADTFVGVPSDSASAWSFERWQSAAPGRDPTALEVLYAGDKSSFYNLIVKDPTYLDGWSGPDPNATRNDFQHLRDLQDGSLQRARAASYALWFNHVASAFDALRAVRIHNIPIRRNLELQLKSSWHGGGPTMAAALERTF
ncbi:MAG TPA: hypothetical protein VI792_12355 [Candidatus Eisenbacteria bacterium]